MVCEAITDLEKTISNICHGSVLSSIKPTLNRKISIKKDIQYFALSFI
nr:MAG TPA: hypothetical protein [Caudoviricetes sp.]